VRKALSDAIAEMKSAGLPFDSPLKGVQYEKRGDEKIDVHGGPGSTGVWNVITATWNGKDYGDVNHGSSFVQAVELTPGCPRARTILTYSQSTDPTSPYYKDQNELYRGKGWVTPPFCAKDMSKLRTAPLTGAEAPLLRGVKVLPGKRAVRVRFGLLRRATVTVVAKRGRTVARRVRRTSLKPGRHTLRLKVPRGRLSIALSARAGSRRETVRLVARRAG
jgi:acyl-homoserine-lactone acylase